MYQLISYSQFKKSEFYQFFNLSEESSTIHGEANELKQYFLKPGGFQEHIDILINTSKELIINATLVLNREWIGNKDKLNPFANDITKSFIGLLFPGALDQEFKINLTQNIWNARGSKDRVLCLDKAVYIWENANPEIKEFLDVYRGSAGSAIRSYYNFEIQMRNEMDIDSKKKRFFLLLKWEI